MLLDYYTTPSLTSACVTHALGFLIVSSTKTTSSIVAPPGYCISERNVDPSENYSCENQLVHNQYFHNVGQRTHLTLPQGC